MSGPEATNAATNAATHAIRHSVALTDAQHVAVVRVEGEDAFDLIDAVTPRELFVQDGQILHTVLLHEDATIFADVYLARDEDDFFVLAEGPDGAALCQYLRAQAAEGADVTLRDLRSDHRLISLSGPYAWELLAELAGPEIIGLPYLTFFYGEDWTCFRTGKTGEFGYDLLVPEADADALWARLWQLGGPFDVAEASVADLDLCALENGFFAMRHLGARPLPWLWLQDLTPIVLQMQWRVSFRKAAFFGRPLLMDRKQHGTSRSVYFHAERVVPQGTAVKLPAGGPVEIIGEVLLSRHSPTRGDAVGLAILDRHWAHPGISEYRADDVVLHTASAPLLNNRSLYVNPQTHSYHTRHEENYPALVSEGSWLASLLKPSS